MQDHLSIDQLDSLEDAKDKVASGKKADSKSAAEAGSIQG